MSLPRSRIATLAALCLLGAALGPATAAASPDGAAAAADTPPAQSPRDGAPARVTLVTGDQVFVRRDDDGLLAVTGVRMAEGRSDGGETWSAARVEADGPEWLVSLRNPGSGVVALRTTASDGGVTYTETLPDAYRLR